MTPEAKISREEFIRRFTDRLVSVVGEEFRDGGSVREYGEQIAASYYEDPYFGSDADPEECADTDMSYWEA